MLFAAELDNVNLIKKKQIKRFDLLLTKCFPLSIALLLSNVTGSVMCMIVAS